MHPVPQGPQDSYPAPPRALSPAPPHRNMFSRFKDWRRIATRYDRCADLFLSACTLAATVLFWL